MLVLNWQKCNQHNGFERAIQIEAGKNLTGSSEGKGEWAAFSVPLSNSDTPLGRDGVSVFNSVSYRDCGEALRYATVFRFVEIRDSRVSSLITDERKLTGHYGALFRRGKLSENIDPAHGRMGDVWFPLTGNQVPPLPSWIPANWLSEDHFVGFLANGWLFSGQQVDQYFWIAKR